MKITQSACPSNIGLLLFESFITVMGYFICSVFSSKKITSCFSSFVKRVILIASSSYFTIFCYYLLSVTLSYMIISCYLLHLSSNILLGHSNKVFWDKLIDRALQTGDPCIVPPCIILFHPPCAICKKVKILVLYHLKLLYIVCLAY